MLVAGTATPRPETWLQLPRIELPRRVDGLPMPPVEVVDMRDADPRSGPLHPDTWEALEGVRRAGGKAIVMINRRGFAALAHLPLLRAPLELPQLRRLADRPPPQRAAGLPPLRPRRAAAGRLPRVRLDDALPRRGRHRAGRGAAGRAAGADAGLPPRLRHRRRPRRPRRHPRPLRRGRERRPGRHPDGRQGPRLPRGDAERDPRRRRDPALPRLPRRGADLRDGRPARRAQRPRRGRGRGDRPDAGAGGAEHRPRRRPRRRRLPGGGARAPPRAALPAVLAPGPDRAGLRAGAAPRRRSPRGSPPMLAGALPEGTDLLGPAPMFRVRGRHRRRLLVKADDREGTVAAVRGVVERLAADRAPARGVASASTSIRSEDSRTAAVLRLGYCHERSASRAGHRRAPSSRRSGWSAARRRSPTSSSSATRC